MVPEFSYGKISAPEEAQQLKAILNQSFNSLSDDDVYFHRIGLDNFRIIRQSGQVAGGLAILEMGQWYGGASVPMAGIAAVGIAPEYRGSGAAIALINATLRELHDRGIPISALYPAVQQLYRRGGYEQAGLRCTWEVSTESIRIRDASLPVQPVTSITRDRFEAINRQQAISSNGNLERNSAIWDELLSKGSNPFLYAYLIGSESDPAGYLVFTQHQDRTGSYIAVQDWALLTDAAIRRFWSFLGHHRSQIEKVRWRSTPVDTLTLLLPEQTATIRSIDRWMLRIVDVKKALEKRGYPAGLQAELHLDIQDELISENNGRWILTVEKGRGEVTSGGQGDLCLTAQSLAPLYTGLFNASQLRMAGRLTGNDVAIATGDRIFAGPAPWMLEFF